MRGATARALSICAGVLLMLQAQAVFAESPRCSRIVSLAPSVTETVYELGLGERLVGRTRFCRYPPEARSVPEVGGFYDVSVEAIIAQKPTHLITLRESADVAAQAARFGAEVIEVDHSSVSGIKESVRRIGERCGASARAEELLSQYASRERAVADQVAQLEKPRTLVVVGRAQQGSETSSLYVSGSDGFYTEVLRLAGARNVHEGRTVAVPLVSPEGLLLLKPEAVVEVVSADDGVSAREAFGVWERLKALPAVRDHKVFVLDDDFASIPGPRYIRLVEKLAQLLHAGNRAGQKEGQT